MTRYGLVVSSGVGGEFSRLRLVCHGEVSQKAWESTLPQSFVPREKHILGRNKKV